MAYLNKYFITYLLGDLTPLHGFGMKAVREILQYNSRQGKGNIQEIIVVTVGFFYPSSAL